MKKKQTALISLMVCVFSLMIKVSLVSATCGSYFANQPIGQQCVDINYDPIDPSVVCQNAVGVCCSSAVECPGAGSPTPTLPQNPGYEESNASCGTFLFDGGLGRQVCLDSSNKILSNALSCPRAPECCREPGNCTKYWTCTDAFACVEDPNGGFSSNQACSLSCVTPLPLQPTSTPAQNTPYTPPINSFFLFRVNPLTINENTNPLLRFVQGVLNLGNFGSPASFLNELLPYLFSLAGMILFIMIVWGGFEMMRGAADTKAQEAGKNRITAALIGFGLLFISYWIAQIVQFIFGVNVLG